IELLFWWYLSSALIRLQLFPSSSENAHHYEIRLHTFIIIKVIINSIYPIHSTVLQLIRPPTFQSVNLHAYRLPINSRMRLNYADQPGSYFYLNPMLPRQVHSSCTNLGKTKLDSFF
ncbi:unnamed protein product, partial [Brassica rapa subsp. trilocularis]